MTDIRTRAQQSSVGELVVLFELNLAPIGDSTILRFTSSRLENGNEIVFRGNTYECVDCAAKGFEYSGTGPMPQPSIQVSNVGGFVGALLVDFEDLVGAELTRIRTFSTYLAGGPDAAEANYAFVKDVFTVEAKQSHTKVAVEWKLSSVLDQQGRKLPGRQVLRDTCLHQYRFFSGGAFNYSYATCPYTGTSYFDGDDNPTTAANDRCGKRLTSCKLRFGANGPLPTRAFPGASRVRSGY